MADTKMAAVQAKLQTTSREFQMLETETVVLVEARQKLDAQQTENEQVLKEFASLKPHNTVYKLIGPGLVKQDLVEAKTNVEKRLDFIKSEIKRIEGSIKEQEVKSGKKKEEIMTLQREFEALQGPSKA